MEITMDELKTISDNYCELIEDGLDKLLHMNKYMTVLSSLHINKWENKDDIITDIDCNIKDDISSLYIKGSKVIILCMDKDTIYTATYDNKTNIIKIENSYSDITESDLYEYLKN